MSTPGYVTCMTELSILEANKLVPVETNLHAALETLVNAEAHLLAEYGARGILKEGPEKRAAQSIDFARARVIAALIRERAAELSGKTLAQIEAESSEAALEAVVELEKQKERDVTKEEERQNHRERMCVDA